MRWETGLGCDFKQSFLPWRCHRAIRGHDLDENQNDAAVFAVTQINENDVRKVAIGGYLALELAGQFVIPCYDLGSALADP
jgi:hypothetical protein